MLRACEKTQLILIDSTKTRSRFNGLLYKEYYHINNWLFLTLKIYVNYISLLPIIYDIV